jgi:Holliday junction resolvase RusA-like endonuclease
MQSCPAIEIVVDLPFPPSVNRIWRGNRGIVHRSKVYIDWVTDADMGVMARRQYPKRKIAGAFEAHVVFNPVGQRGDLDNRIKAVLDWAQSRDLIRNDSDCRRLIAEWGDAEHGCRLTLREVEHERVERGAAQRNSGAVE